MDKIRIVARSYDDAINEAILKLETTSDNMIIEVEEEGNSGFLGLFSKPWILNISKKENSDTNINNINTTTNADNINNKKVQQTKQTKEDRREKELKEIRKEREIRELKRQKELREEAEVKELIKTMDIDSIKSKAKIFLDNILKEFDIHADYEFVIEGINFMINMNSSDEMGIIIGKRGQTLDAIQYLLNLHINKNFGSYFRVKLNTENYREKRQEKLSNLAINIAKKVKNSKKAVKLEPMNPYERRIVHNALQMDKYIFTKSEGVEPFRYVVILPRNNYDNRRKSRNIK